MRSFCSGHGGFYLLRHGQYNTAGVQRAPKLPDMSNQRNRVNPYRSPQSGVGSREADNGDVGMGARKEANAAL